VGIKLTTLVVKGTDSIGKSNYYLVMAMTPTPLTLKIVVVSDIYKLPASHIFPGRKLMFLLNFHHLIFKPNNEWRDS
jgi:hypothetical protein